MEERKEANVVRGCASGVVVSKECRFHTGAAGCVCETTITCTEGGSGGAGGGGGANETGTAEVPPPVALLFPTYPDEESCLNDLQKNKEMAAEGGGGCSEAACPVEFQPSCPGDSVLLAGKAEPGECCEKTGRCICQAARCLQAIPACPSGAQLRRVHEAAKEPGDCCDRYACQELRLHCSHRGPCPQLQAQDCPEDSERPPPIIPAGECCPVLRPCECRAGICSVAPSCPPSTSRQQRTTGDGTPGNCCDSFACVSTAASEATEVGNWSADPFLFPLLHSEAMETSPPGEKRPCAHGNKFYADGQRWNANECTACVCRNKLTFCQKMTCPPLPDTCSWVDVPAGECCPLCMGCISATGDRLNLTDSYAPDDCTTCTCGPNGRLLCQSQTCNTACDNPVKVPGTCCPVCQEKDSVVALPATCPRLEHCPLRCPKGLRRDEKGCFLCQCSEPPMTPSPALPPADCEPLSEANCPHRCANGYALDGRGCPTCVCASCPTLHRCYKHCLYGFQRDAEGCPRCACLAREEDLSVALASEDAELKLLGNGSTSGGVVAAGPKGLGCEAKESGEWWTEGCRHCYCEDGVRFCSLLACPQLDEDCDEVLPADPGEGECCPRCATRTEPLSSAVVGGNQFLHAHTVCHGPGTGRVYVDGEAWELHPCVACTCRIGHVLCHPKPCPPAPCAQPIKAHPLDCCPSCPEEAEEAPPAGQDEQTVCTEPDGTEHPHGAIWRRSDCVSCRCNESGEAECFEESCPRLSCLNRPLRLRGRCCPLCTDAAGDALCAYNNRLFRPGQTWAPDVCENCTCATGGQTQCERQACQPCPEGLFRPAETVELCCPPCRRLEGGSGAAGLNLALAGLSLGLFLLVLLLVAGLVYLYRRRGAAERAAKDALLPRTAGVGGVGAKRPRSKPSGEEGGEALLATSDSGSSSSSSYKPTNPPHAAPPTTAARAASFNHRQLAPWSEADARPRSCHLQM